MRSSSRGFIKFGSFVNGEEGLRVWTASATANVRAKVLNLGGYHVLVKAFDSRGWSMSLVPRAGIERRSDLGSREARIGVRGTRLRGRRSDSSG